MFLFSFVSGKKILLDISRGVIFIAHKGTLLNQNTTFGGFCDELANRWSDFRSGYQFV